MNGDFLSLVSMLSEYFMTDTIKNSNISVDLKGENGHFDPIITINFP